MADSLQMQSVTCAVQALGCVAESPWYTGLLPDPWGLLLVGVHKFALVVAHQRGEPVWSQCCHQA